MLNHPTGPSEQLAVDIGYEDAAFAAKLFIPVYAAQDGRVSFVEKAENGFAVSVDHGTWSTHYAHLDQVFIATRGRALRRAEHVRAGDVVGYAAGAPVHVRFELWQLDNDELVPVDPEPHLEQWLVLPQFDRVKTAA
ncbi:MAG: M23 family metallopeptidase [Kofleriaceae bacterium]